MYLIEYGVLQHEILIFYETLLSLNRKLTKQSSKHLLKEECSGRLEEQDVCRLGELSQEVLSLLFPQLTVKAEEGFYKNRVFML